ncbi:hypothetical protein [Chryseosolibacter indicus]|uniref:PorV/PorQ family protein n=1 Tax=Chryseosolibacter indicus TaxID=2782351 RepID=A0ABS5VX66_9BACT|nr:hypothetical protein [Chryseosolibacter indicus]MBT1705479.1 hypothetical protein [Chryseosolibacter indicus]
MGARAAGMAYASSCLKDEWSIFNNVGGLSSAKETTVAFTYDVSPAFPTFNRMAALIASPFKVGTFGLGAFKFGDDLYNEQILSTAFSNKLGIASLGISANYIQYATLGFGNKSVFSLSFGGIASLTPMLDVGAHIQNINQPVISEDSEEERLPTRLTIGLAFKPSSKLLISSEIEKQLDLQAIWKTGVEYQFNKKFFCRTGFNIDPDAAFLGVGFMPEKLSLNYAMEYNIRLGISHQASVSYKFKKR